MTSYNKILSFEEVSKHNLKTDCWLIISGKVYDVTTFLDDHPGGDEVLVLATEKDATQDFEDVGHSQDAKDMLKDYYVGELDVNTLTRVNKSNTSSSTASPNQDSGSSSTNKLTFILPIIILVLAYALYYLGKKEV